MDPRNVSHPDEASPPVSPQPSTPISPLPLSSLFSLSSQTRRSGLIRVDGESVTSVTAVPVASSEPVQSYFPLFRFAPVSLDSPPDRQQPPPSALPSLPFEAAEVQRLRMRKKGLHKLSSDSLRRVGRSRFEKRRFEFSVACFEELVSRHEPYSLEHHSALTEWISQGKKDGYDGLDDSDSSSYEEEEEEEEEGEGVRPADLINLMSRKKRKRRPPVPLPVPDADTRANDFIWLGASYSSLDRHSEALHFYNCAVWCHPYHESFYHRGFAYAQLKQYEHALRDFTVAIRKHPTGTYWSAYNQRGCVYDDLGEFESAILDYSDAIRIRPHYYEALNNRGFARANLKQFTDAVQDYTRAIQVKPKSCEALCNRAHARHCLRQYSDALVDYTAGLRMLKDDRKDPLKAPNDELIARTLIRQAMVRCALGGDCDTAASQYLKAKSDIAEAYSLKPDFPRLAEYLSVFSDAVADLSRMFIKLPAHEAIRAMRVKVDKYVVRTTRREYEKERRATMQAFAAYDLQLLVLSKEVEDREEPEEEEGGLITVRLELYKSLLMPEGQSI